jgi:ABC-2 type transport system permease protein
MTDRSLTATETMTAFRFRRSQTGTVLWRTLRDNLPGIIAWGCGYSVLLSVVVFLYPVLEDNNTLLSLISGLGLLDVLADQYFVDPRVLGTFPGYLALEVLAWTPLILSVYLIPQAMRAIMDEEQQGTLDLLMSAPISRSQFLIEKTLAVVISLLLILFIMWLSLIGSTAIVEESELSLQQATSGIWHLLPICLVILAATLALSVGLRNPRTVGGLAALIVIGSLFVRSLADATSAPLLERLRVVSLFHYYTSLTVLLDGVTWRQDLTLTAAALVLFLLALWLFRRRDLGV